MRSIRALAAWACVASTAATLVSSEAEGQQVVFGNDALANEARIAIYELDVKKGAELLRGADPTHTGLALERARLGLYTGDCAEAARIMRRKDLESDEEAALSMMHSALGCERGLAATIQVEDERGVVVRLQDDADRVLVPLLVHTALETRENLTAELGVELPLPMRIDLVRDQFTLAAMTGLPVESARTTGTVAVAKWGRVIMVSPRANSDGFPFLDTLAHELTHLALTRGTRDRAPLWLQEGVAKRQEIRWREASPFDWTPSPDHVAAMGLRKDIGPPIDQIGPSIAMLDSAQAAAVTFAKVTSFMSYFVEEAGADALPRVLVAMKNAVDGPGVEAAIEQVTDKPFDVWAEEWRQSVLALPESDQPSSPFDRGTLGVAEARELREVSQRNRLGELLAQRGHHAAASQQYARAQSLAPREPVVRCGLVDALLHLGLEAEAAPFVASPADVGSDTGRWWSLHGRLHPDVTANAFAMGVALNPLSAEVGCEELAPPALPNDPIRRALCEATRAHARK